MTSVPSDAQRRLQMPNVCLNRTQDLTRHEATAGDQQCVAWPLALYLPWHPALGVLMLREALTCLTL